MTKEEMKLGLYYGNTFFAKISFSLLVYHFKNITLNIFSSILNFQYLDILFTILTLTINIFVFKPFWHVIILRCMYLCIESMNKRTWILRLLVVSSCIKCKRNG